MAGVFGACWPKCFYPRDFTVIDFIVKVVLSYLLGSIIGSLVVGRLYGGVDIRKEGSGNAGATNALRTRGKMFAVWVLLIDILKGWIAVRGMALFAFEPRVTNEAAEVVLATYHNWATWEFFVKPACAIAVIVGHLYPVWFGFRGGKGVATLVGVVLALNPLLLLPLLLTWLIAVMLFGYVGLASMIATVSIPVAALLGMSSFTWPFREGSPAYFRALESIPGDPAPFVVRAQEMFWPRDLQLLLFGCAAVVIVVFSHRSNIARMRSGTEPRVRKLWLFRGKRT